MTKYLKLWFVAEHKRCPILSTLLDIAKLLKKYNTARIFFVNKICPFASRSFKSMCFRFPKTHYDLWSAATQRTDLPKTPLLCSLHFHPSDFIQSTTAAGASRTRLKNNAVPSIFSFPTSLEKYSRSRKSPKKRIIPYDNLAIIKRQLDSTVRKLHQTEQELCATKRLLKHTQIQLTASRKARRKLSLSSHSFKRKLPEEPPPAKRRKLSLSSHSFKRKFPEEPPPAKRQCLCNSPPDGSVVVEGRLALIKKYNATKLDHVRKVSRRKDLTIYRLRANVKRLKTEALGSKPKVITKDSVIRYIKATFRGTTADLLTSQIRLQGKSEKGKRFTLKDKEIGLTFFYSSPKCYRTLRRMLTLPSPTTLRRLTQGVDVRAGVSEFVIRHIAKQVEKMPAMEKVVSIQFDEIKLSKGLKYEKHLDRVEGYEDFGEFGRTSKIADHALKFLVRGIAVGYKQVVSHYLVKTACGGEMLAKLIPHIIKMVESTGLIVKTLICDAGTGNQRYAKLLKVTPDKPYIIYEDRKIYLMFDPPHLLKATRNNLQAHDFTIGSGKASWRYIRDFYEVDRTLDPRAAPKLTCRHLNLPPFSKMSVSLAGQVFSGHVEVGMEHQVSELKLPSEAVTTIHLVGFMNKLLDCFNSLSTHDPNPYKRGISENSQAKLFLESAGEYIQSWVIHEGKNIYHFKQGWLISINATLLLWEDLKNDHGFKFLLTRRLNQDALENIFGQCRMYCGPNTNPPVTEFSSIAKRVMISSLLRPPPSTNCQHDTDIVLLDFSTFTAVRSTPNPTAPKSDLSVFSNTSFNGSEFALFTGEDSSAPSIETLQRNVLADGPMYYFCGFVAKMFLKTHRCETCKVSLLCPDDAEFTETHQSFTAMKAYSTDRCTFSGLKVSTTCFFQFLKVCNEEFAATFERYQHQDHVLENIVNEYIHKTLPNLEFQLCSHDSLIAIVQYFLRCKIYFSLRFTNRELNNTVVKKKFVKK